MRISSLIGRGALVVCLCQAFVTEAVPSSALPDISLLSGYTEFGNAEMESLVTINGNVGVSSGGDLNLMAPSTINGNVYVSSGATFQHAGTVSGSVFTGQDLAANQSQVFSASTTLGGLAPNYTFATLSTLQNFSATAGNVTVVNVGALNLNNVNINFTGSGYLVINVTGSFSMGGTAGILAADPTHVFVNYTGTSTLNTHVGDSVDGYLFVPNAAGNLDGTFFGGLYGGDGALTLLSGATLRSQSTSVPDATSSALLLLLACGFVVIARRKLAA
jgi:hypothetical protein